MTTENLTGALTGMALAAAVQWGRYDDDTQRRLRNVRLDQQQMDQLVRDFMSRGEVLRSRLTPVQDAQVGLALASQMTQTAQLIPSTTPLSRPDFVGTAQAAVTSMTWPPEPGQYDERGMVKQVGELTQLFLALTYEEVRAFLQGLPQKDQPTAECKRQIFFAANSLTMALCGLNLTHAEFVTAWKRLFSGASLSTAHANPALSPKVVGALGQDVASVTPLTLLSNPQTDRASRWRVTAGANPIAAGTPVATIQFGSEWKWAGGPLQPAVSINSPFNSIFANNISSSALQIYNTQIIPASGYVDFFMTATAGVEEVG